MEDRCINNEREFYYNISSKVSMDVLYSQRKMGNREIREFIFGLSRVADSVKEYLLDINCLCMEQEMIFIDSKTGIPEFCYNPDAKGDFFLSLKRLLQQMLTIVDYEDRPAVEAAYRMQEISTRENYTVEELFGFVNLGYDVKKERLKEQTKGAGSVKLPEKSMDMQGSSTENGKEPKAGGTLRKVIKFIFKGFDKRGDLTTLEELERDTQAGQSVWSGKD